MVKIEKGIPLPKARNVGMTDTLCAMEVGDSIAVDADAANATNVTTRRHPLLKTRKFVRKTEADKVRFWRAA